MYYQYIASTAENKLAKGVQVAASADVATKILTGQGYRVLSLKPASSFMPRWERLLPPVNRISTQAVITFSRQMALLHESGMDIVTSLGLLREQAQSRWFKGVLKQMVADLHQGEKLSKAMSKHSGVFPLIYVQSVRMAEQTGHVGTVLKQMADHMEKEANAMKSIKNALKYPIAVLVVAAAVIGVLVTFVLPSFANLYSSIGAELPILTSWMLISVRWLSQYGMYCMALVALLGLGLWLWSRTPEGKLERDKIMLQLPLLGKVAQWNELIRCCRTLAILYKAGLPVPDIIQLAIETSQNLVMKEALGGVHQDVQKGEGLSRPMAKRQIFLPMMVQMVGVGEATGTLDHCLHVTAEAFETEAEDKMRQLIGLIQPAITIIMGAIVALIALSLISAMYSFYGQVM